MIPVLILGGQENALAVARSLGRRGVPVNISADNSCMALKSRYCSRSFAVPQGVESQSYWTELLLSERYAELRGSVVFACSDDALEFIAQHREQLDQYFRLDDTTPEEIETFLDKKKTLTLAESVGIAIPKFWELSSVEEAEQIRDDMTFPVIVKPLASHIFQRHFPGRKYLLAENFQQLTSHLEQVFELNIDVMVNEKIPGPDDLLSSYNAYYDATGERLYRFTKQVVRRSPYNEGTGSLHRAVWDDETATEGEKFFRAIDYRGMANIEFKKDPRDGRLKIIECNVRCTLAVALLVRGGLDVPYRIYRHVIGDPLPASALYDQNCWLWNPVQDFFAYRELSEMGLLTAVDWVKSIAHRKVIFPFMSVTDPVPGFANFVNLLRGYFNKQVR